MQSYKKAFRQVADFVEGASSAATYFATGGRSIGYQSERRTSKAHANGGMAGIMATITSGVTTAVVVAHQAMTLMR